MSPSAEWIDDRTLEVDGVRFVSDPTHRFASEVDRFCLVKRPDLVQSYLDLLDADPPRRIVELGVFQGGSTALLALLFAPDLLLAVERKERPVAALDQLVADRDLATSVKVAYGVDQADTATLEALLDEHLGSAPLDLVLDDASHLVDPTRSSFEVLFPRLRPGGSYIIEDWSWAHIGYETANPGEVPLTSVVFELVMALPSRPGLIAEVRVDRDWAVIVRGEAELDPADFTLGSSYSDRSRSLVATLDPEGRAAWQSRWTG